MRRDDETPQRHGQRVGGMTTRIEVNSATAAPTSRSSSSGKEMAPIVSATYGEQEADAGADDNQMPARRMW
jgi:hypothetical protein